MMLVDIMATVVAIFFCGLTWLESRKKERSIARSGCGCCRLKYSNYIVLYASIGFDRDRNCPGNS